MAQRRKSLEQIAAGEAHVVVGTHALIQKGVDFDDLSLVVVDEQHRFGVGQRTVFREKGTTPDTLIMTATPIPRTLSLTLYGDLEVSLIDELPPGRKPVETRIVDPAERLGAYEEVRREIEEGRQAYVICPLVEESEALEDVRAAEELYEELANEIFPERRVGLLHGRMKAQDKREVMAAVPGRGDRSACGDRRRRGRRGRAERERDRDRRLRALRPLPTPPATGAACAGALHPPKCFLVGAPKTEDSERRLEALDHATRTASSSPRWTSPSGARARSSVAARAACPTSRSPSSCATWTSWSRPGARRSPWSPMIPR